jgi:hypothetical protein
VVEQMRASFIAAVALFGVAGLAACGASTRGLQPASASAASSTLAAASAADGAPTGWFCPMHPDVTASEPGRCRKCNMALIAGNPFDTREYVLDLATSPAAVEPGMPFTLRLRVRPPSNGEPVRRFEVVHGKPFHLFVVSHDMTVFEHLHPELNTSGEWEIEISVPKAGYYRVLSDFVPTGGSPQFIGRTLVTAGFDGDIVSEAARLVPDTELTQTVDSITATVAFEPDVLLSGEYGHLEFTLTDAHTGQPIRDLEPYLGAYGHTLILSEDLLDVVHAHPSEWFESESPTTPTGGPRLTFEGYLPRPGHYRAWTQFLRGGHLSTFTFTFRVYSPYEAFKAGAQ